MGVVSCDNTPDLNIKKVFVGGGGVWDIEYSKLHLCDAQEARVLEFKIRKVVVIFVLGFLACAAHDLFTFQTRDGASCCLA
jgi:hypothetical protein